MRPCLATALIVVMIAPVSAAAQWPGTVVGRVIDATTGEAIATAVVEIPALSTPASSARTGPSGSFSLQAIEPGLHTVRAAAPGYLDHHEEVQVRNGAATRVDIALRPQLFDIDPLHVRATPLERTLVLDREEIAHSGARTAADVLDRLPGVVVGPRGPTAPATVSIRGSDDGHVLVILDGVVLNDPVTGAADLSTISTATIESVSVYPGARSVRYGPGAVAGVVVIESRRPEPGLRLESGVGSMGERRGALGLGAAGSRWTAELTGHAARIDGEFDYAVPPEAGGGSGTRSNADLAEVGGLLAAVVDFGSGALRWRLGADRIRRGLPGKAYAPSPEARQELERARAGATWNGSTPGGLVEATIQAVDERVRHHDAAPPAGLPYDHTARVGEARSELVLGGSGGGLIRGWRTGIQLSGQWIRSDALTTDAPSARIRGGAFLGGETTIPLGAAAIDLGLDGRLDRDGTGDLHPSYAASASLGMGAARLYTSVRSSFTPPSLADQFFRQGVAVEPNPLLRGERVPLELELGARARLAGRVQVDAGATLFRGDVRDMIVWAPDFRFVWKPRNTDVRRWGGEVWTEAMISAGLRARASYSLAVVTYDTPGSAGAQLPYRPRHTGRGALEWRSGPWRASIASDYTGERYPTAAHVNRLPPYWRTEVATSRAWRFGHWQGDLSLRVDRLLDEKESMIFGYPEPGRTFRLRLNLERTLRP